MDLINFAVSGSAAAREGGKKLRFGLLDLGAPFFVLLPGLGDFADLEDLLDLTIRVWAATRVPSLRVWA